MTEERLPSKFTFILHADIAGSTALVQQDEELAHKRIQDTFRRFDETITKYHGYVRELRGDALLAEFERASDAVTAALGFQADQSEFLAQHDDAIQPKVRVGIAMGEVIVADETLTGAGVVLAQRMEQLAEPGGVCITGAIQEALPPRLPFDQGDLGEQQVKGFDNPVRVYTVGLSEGAALPEPTITSVPRKSKVAQFLIVAAVVALICGGGLLAWVQPWVSEFEPASAEEMAFPLPDKPSIAVLPFDNLSGDRDQDFLADGLTEEIITTLSKVPDLFVIARHSTDTYKGKTVPIKQVAEEQGVRYVLEGSVQRAGDRIRINAQLIDALEGNHLWAERYDREFQDLFDLQDDITRNVAIALQIQLTVGEMGESRRKGTTNPEAFLLAHKAAWYYRRFNKEDTARARELVQKAREIDPDALFALQMEGWIHYQQSRFGWSPSREESLRKAEEIAELALEIDDEDPYTHLLLGSIARGRKNLDQAILHVGRAIELNPNHNGAIGVMALVLNYAGRPEEAIPFSKKAMRLSPVNPPWMPANLGLSYMMIGEYEKAIAAYEEVLASGAMTVFANERLTAIYSLKGDLEKAKEYANKLLEVKPDFTIEGWSNVLFYKNKTDLTRELNALRMAGLPENPPPTLPDKPSIAVLPFTNMSDDAQQEYFVDGMTEDLITDLSKVSGLFIIARNSAFTYKNKDVKVKQVAEELGVRYVLEGSVRKAGDQVRINAQLIDATTGGHLWAERYDGVISNVFSLQDEITTKIVTALAVELTTNEEVEQAKNQTKNPQAYDAFLRGLEHYRRDTTDHYGKAMEYFRQAVELDPGYSRAYAAMASIYWKSYLDEFYQVFQIGRTDARERGQELLQQALLNPTSLAYQVASEISLWRRDHAAAISDGEKAIALDSNSAHARVVLANALIFSGRPGDALEFMNSAEELDPLGTARYEYVRGVAFFGLGQYDKAAVALERARELNPGDWAANEPGKTWCYPCEILAATYGHLGRLEDAEAVIGYLNKFGYHRGTIGGVIPNWPYKEAEDAERFVVGLRKAGLPE